MDAYTYGYANQLIVAARTDKKLVTSLVHLAALYSS